MAEYKGIKGFKVQTVSTDPAASAIAGGTWASGENLNTARRSLGQSGTQTAALVLEEMLLHLAANKNLIMELLGQK
jgi:hypothetical protein